MSDLFGRAMQLRSAASVVRHMLCIQPVGFDILVVTAPNYLLYIIPSAVLSDLGADIDP